MHFIGFIATYTIYLLTYTNLTTCRSNIHREWVKKPFTSWIVAEENGKLVLPTAGLGESCSHIASLIGVCIRDSATVTQKKAYWVIPNGIMRCHMLQWRAQILSGKKEVFQNWPHWISYHLYHPLHLHQQHQNHLHPISNILQVPEHELRDHDFLCIFSTVFLETSNFISSGSMLLCSKITGKWSSYVSIKSEYLHKNYGELIKHAEECEPTVTPDEVTVVEVKTKSQSKSCLWFAMRTGRTASHSKSASRTNLALPSFTVL